MSLSKNAVIMSPAVNPGVTAVSRAKSRLITGGNGRMPNEPDNLGQKANVEKEVLASVRMPGMAPVGARHLHAVVPMAMIALPEVSRTVMARVLLSVQVAV